MSSAAHHRGRSPAASPPRAVASATISAVASQDIEAPARYYRTLRAFQPSPEPRLRRPHPEPIAHDPVEDASQNMSRYYRTLRAFQPSPEPRLRRPNPETVDHDPVQDTIDPRPASSVRQPSPPRSSPLFPRQPLFSFRPPLTHRSSPPTRTFQVSPPPQATRTFQVSPPPQATRTFQVSPPPQRTRTFQPSPPPRDTRTFQVSPPPPATRRPDPYTVNRDSIQDIEAGHVVLFCGLDIDAEHPSVSDASMAPHPQILPLPPSPTPEPPRKRQKRSTGCGTRVHTNARAVRQWRGSVSGASADVVPLERAYFAPEAIKQLNLHENNCGCAIRGVGCRVCGNPLGALKTWCELHRSDDPSRAYTFLPCAVSPPLRPFIGRPPPIPPTRPLRHTARMSTGGRPPPVPMRRPDPAPPPANDDDLSDSSDEDSPLRQEVARGWTRFVNDHLDTLTAGYASPVGEGAGVS
ncbi:hypothetical protein B0H19DRAFT_1270550 [Mycena capillaripes]|nr:hypothetical protein B0H19DRAFT_1270550 [Mycena capillaripes]